MNRNFKQLLLSLRRWHKNVLLISTDATLAAFALWLAFALRIGPPSIPTLVEMLPLFALVSGTTIVGLWLLGTYSHLLRAISLRVLNIIALAVLASAIMIAVFGYFDQSILIPRSIPVLFFAIAVTLIGTSRITGRWLYRNLVGLTKRRQPIMVYGAGEAGIHVSAVLDNSRDFSFIGFVDDDKNLWGNKIRGRKVYSIDSLKLHSERFEDLRVLISIGNITNAQKRNIIERLQDHPVQIMTVPPLQEVVAGRADLSSMQEVQIEELLGRDPVPPISSLFQEALEGKTVLITGGGGSIGSEICRQVSENSPNRIIVLESSEIALYKLEQSMQSDWASRQSCPEIHYRLGNVTSMEALDTLFDEFKPDIVYHAAAFKHVPIVEDNVTQGVANNVLGTYNAASLAAKHKVKRFILISTDKAVRPTNVMGATKRVAELVVQALAKGKTKTIFSMVRFGNVLGSSGSVIPRFRQQIAAGGPVTVTHPEITRYFMTIPEAAQLVIQAGSMAKGGEVFLLDMGEPVEIVKLAKLMIQLSGKSTRDESNLNGEIEIEFTGLRPGEKLYEELLATDNASGTNHPKIMTAEENSFSKQKMDAVLKSLKTMVENNDKQAAINVLQELVEGFSRS